MVDTIRALWMERRVERAVIAHLRAALPCEGCGLFATVDRGDGVREVVRFYPGENVDRSPTRYTMDSRQVLEAIEELEARGWDLGGIVHSHPRSAPVPSETDLKEAYYRESLLAIVSFESDEPLMRAWRLEPEGSASPFAEVAVEVVAPEAG